jgi:hypothetical protein
MSSKAPNYRFSPLRVNSLLVLLACTFMAWSTRAQVGLEDWKQLFDARCTLADVEAFESHVALNAFGTPSLKTAVPALDPLEVALQPWGADRELENQCMQALLSSDARRLLQLNALYTLHQAIVEEAWSATALPPAFRWIPALATGWNQSAAIQSDRAGLWWNDRGDAVASGLTLSGAIDDRGVPMASTQAAIAQLEKLQRRFPNDPHRVLVAYMKGMAYATRWSGRPGYDRQLDEWLALYKVVSRMMVNTDLPDHQADWIDVLSAWEPITCTGERTRPGLMEQQSIPAGVLTQFLPWWTGTTLPCSVLDVYDVALPSAYAARWNADDALQVQSTPTPTPAAPAVAATESEPYTVAYTCELHEVKAGDTLWNISKRYPGTTPERIAEINEITDYIRIGEVLCIPIQP